MGLITLIEEKRSKIVKEWFKLTIKTYPKEKSDFFKKKKDSMANPVGNTLSKSLEDILKGLTDDVENNEMAKILDPSVRLRAVQEFAPSSAVSYIFFLKNVIRDILKKDLTKEIEKELLIFESKIDRVSLIAFDIYMGCREQIFTYKANHVKERTLKLLEKADLLCEVPEVGAEIIPHNVYLNGGFDDK
ncbi:MAG: hypothetical protein GY714_26095 [Desulfobacterales bacterium]|nr:hypothetical protein [Desulfobacterales bacterium]MCP4162348.1 hypothetical protein [Deltaproteobacteria bacterium]